MKRNLSALRNGQFDVVVVGAGIYGAWTAYDAALRGLRVALVDAGDWSAATSSSSSKLIHGGLRYLERYDFGLVRKSLVERKRLAQLAPHRVQPLRFVLPHYRGDRLGWMKLKAGLSIYDLLSGPGQPVAFHRHLDNRQLAHEYPSIESRNTVGGFTYGDAVTDDFRFALEIVDGAAHAGAVTAHYTRAVSLVRSGRRVAGLTLRDELHGGTFDVGAKVVVNAAGPWLTELLASDDHPRLRLTKGVHLLLPALPETDAMLLTAPSDGRVFFVIPWYGRTLLGTTDTDYKGSVRDVVVDDADIDYLLNAANDRLRVAWSRSDILGSFAGVRTLHDEPGATASAVSREWSVLETEPGLLTSFGGKYTSARADAAVIVDRIVRILGAGSYKCPTQEKRFPWAPRGDFATWLSRVRAELREAGCPKEVADTAPLRHGTRVDRLLARLVQDPSEATALALLSPFCRAEVHVAIEDEGAVRADDVWRRRVPVGLTEAKGSADFVYIEAAVNQYQAQLFYAGGNFAPDSSKEKS